MGIGNLAVRDLYPCAVFGRIGHRGPPLLCHPASLGTLSKEVQAGVALKLQSDCNFATMKQAPGGAENQHSREFGYGSNEGFHSNENAR